MNTETDTKTFSAKPAASCAAGIQEARTGMQQLGLALRATGQPFMMLDLPGSALQLPAHMRDLQPANQDRA